MACAHAAGSRAPREPRQGGRRSSGFTTTSRSGIARNGRITSARSKGASEMLPNVQRTDAADHVPVLADEVRELLDVQPGETVVDATFGAGGHSRLLVAGLGGSGKIVAIDRDPTRSPVLRPREGGRPRRADALPARRLRSRALAARRQRRPCRCRPARPRHLVDAGRPPRARLLVRDGRATRHAHGSVRRAKRCRRSRDVRRARARDDLPEVRRGALRESDRTRDRQTTGRGADRAHRAARRRRQGVDPGAGALR